MFLYACVCITYHAMMQHFTYSRTLLLCALMCAFILPSSVSAAPKQPSCDLVDHAKSACIDESLLETKKRKPKIEGEAAGLKNVRIVVRKDDTVIWKSKATTVRKGIWKTSIKKSLKDGEYKVAVYRSSNLKKDPLDEEILTIGTVKTKGTVSATPIPLLAGGMISRGDKAPVAYIQLVNTGESTTTLEGFTLTQNGTLDPKYVTSFKTSDDKGGSQTIVDTKINSFDGKSIFVPLKATLKPGQMRIFTLLAFIGKDAPIGNQLKLDVASIKTDAAMQAKFPIRGVTWTTK